MTFSEQVKDLPRALSTLSAACFKTKPTPVAIAINAMLAGCAIHPVQQDVTGIPTKQVVDLIRCEVKYAVLSKATRQLRERAVYYRAQETNSRQSAAQLFAIARSLDAIADDLDKQRNKGEQIKFDPSKLPTDAAIKFYNHFINSGLAYEFTFDISENNSSNLAVDPVRLITGGTAGLTVGGGATLQRSNIRRFQLTDTFGELLATERLRCTGREVTLGNYSYPVAGNLGLEELISSFVDLGEGQLVQKSPQDGTVFGDTMKFTTSINGGLTPHVQIAAIGNRFGTAGPATLQLNASRTDIHMLTISLSMGAEGDVPLHSVRARPGFVEDRRGPPRAPPRSAANVEQALQNLEVQRSKNLQDNLNILLGR